MRASAETFFIKCSRSPETTSLFYAPSLRLDCVFAEIIHIKIMIFHYFSRDTLEMNVCIQFSTVCTG